MFWEIQLLCNSTINFVTVILKNKWIDQSYFRFYIRVAVCLEPKYMGYFTVHYYG